MMPQSHTSLSCYTTCPRQYEAKYVTKEVKFEPTEATIWGDFVHRALENYVKDGTPLPSNVQMYHVWGDAVRRRAGKKIVEGSLAVTKALQPCQFFDKDAWLRAKLDVLILRDDEADILDYKTGKRKDNVEQLRRYALLVLINYPEVQRVRCGFIWLRDGVLTKPSVFTRDQIPDMLMLEEPVFAQIEADTKAQRFDPRPSGLCNGWCQVRRCEFWRPKKGEDNGSDAGVEG